jgi:hypothetical protein
MVYVQRDADENICGLYANPQPGYAEELLPENDPEVVAYLESIKIPPPPEAKRKRK